MCLQLTDECGRDPNHVICTRWQCPYGGNFDQAATSSSEKADTEVVKTVIQRVAA